MKSLKLPQFNLRWFRRHRKALTHLRYILFALFVPICIGVVNLSGWLAGHPGANAASSERIARLDSNSQMLSEQSALAVLMGIISLALAILFHRQTRKIARNCPLALTPGKRSRFSARGLFSKDFHFKIFVWEYLGSWAVTLGIVLLCLAWAIKDAHDLASFPFVWSLVTGGVIGFFLACYLDQHYTSLRPRVDTRNGQPMKPISRGEDLSDYLSDAEQVAWKLGSIQPQGWYSTVDPSAVYICIFDRPLPSSYSKCPNCQEYIVSQDSNIVEKPTYKHKGVRCISYRCNCCDYFDSTYVSIPRKQPARGHAPGNPGPAEIGRAHV